jgi:hypothetical protein
VVAPPGVHRVGSEVRQVQLAALTLSPPALLGALEKFIRNQAQTVVPGTKVVAGGAADVPAAAVKTATAGGTTPLTFDSAIDPAINSQVVNNTALAATTTALSIPAPLLPIIGTILLFGPLIVLVVLACPPCALFNFLTFTIPSFFIPYAPLSAVAAASTATVDANATVAPSLTSDPLPQVDETRKADVAQPVTLIDKRIRTEQVKSTEPGTESEPVSTDTATLTKDVTEAAKTDEASAGPTAVSNPKPSASTSTSEPTKPAERPATPRPVVRDSLKVGEQLSAPPHRGNGGHPATRAAAAGDGDGNSSGGDPDDSDDLARFSASLRGEGWR